MTDRERLYELIVETENNLNEAFPYTTDKHRIEETVEHLLRNNVTVMEFKPEVFYRCYYDAIKALADMVIQFGFETTFRKQYAVCDGGLSALKTVFYALEENGCRLTSNGKIKVKELLRFQEEAEKALAERNKL